MILLSPVESGDITGFISATTVTTICYLAAKAVGSVQAKTEIDKLFTLLKNYQKFSDQSKDKIKTDRHKSEQTRE